MRLVESVPPVRYARAQGAELAYQVFGQGPATIVAVPPLAQNIELGWEWPAIRRMLERFATFSRYLHFDKRGTGASDRTIDVADIDQRVDDLRAVMDDAGIGRAHLFGVSEGGPMTLLFAATYPDRVAGVVLDSTAARLADRDAFAAGSPQAVDHQEAMQRFADAWGTPDSTTVDLFAPSLAADESFRRWHQRYERQAASRDTIHTLLLMNGRMDARGVLGEVRCPVLVLRRRDDPTIAEHLVRETVEGLPDARLVEMPGADHFTYAADADAVLDEIERFVTGSVGPATVPIHPPAVAVTTLGRFAVVVDGVEVPDAAWGSRRARQLLKRLAVARGWPVAREELAELLWPDEPDPDRWRPRLSVQLSTVRRILGGGVLADRTSVRLDLDHVALDLVALERATSDEEVLDVYTGDLLPEDRDEDWVEPLRVGQRARALAAGHRLLATIDGDDGIDRDGSGGSPDRVVALALRLLEIDPDDDAAHTALIRAHWRAGAPAAARAAHTRYAARLAELDLEAPGLEDVVGGGPGGSSTW